MRLVCCTLFIAPVLLTGLRGRIGEEPADTPQTTATTTADPRDVFQYRPLPTISPHRVKVKGAQELDVVAFYAPTVPLTEWDRRTGGGPFGNFWPLYPDTITVTHNGSSGTFGDTESAYQAFKWWQDGYIRNLFEQCAGPTMRGGSCAYKIKRGFEGLGFLSSMKKYYEADYDGLGKYEAMKLVLRQKWRLPTFKKFLLDTKGFFLAEHCAKKGRDPYWTDDLTGGGQNRLGAALMVVRGEILLEEGSDTDGWPEGLQRPEFEGGPADSNWQEMVDEVAQQLVADSEEPVLTPAPPPPLTSTAPPLM